MDIEQLVGGVGMLHRHGPPSDDELLEMDKEERAKVCANIIRQGTQHCSEMTKNLETLDKVEGMLKESLYLAGCSGFAGDELVEGIQQAIGDIARQVALSKAKMVHVKKEMDRVSDTVAKADTQEQ